MSDWDNDESFYSDDETSSDDLDDLDYPWDLPNNLEIDEPSQDLDEAEMESSDDEDTVCEMVEEVYVLFVPQNSTDIVVSTVGAREELEPTAGEKDAIVPSGDLGQGHNDL